MKEIRELHNHMQEYLIENTHLHISHYENLQKFPSLETISLFCNFYKISLGDFFAPMNYPEKE